MRIPVCLVASVFLALAPFSFAIAGVNDSILRTSDTTGDGRGEVLLFDPSEARFRIHNPSSLKTSSYVFGDRYGIPVSGDFNGDGKADLGTFNTTAARWTLNLSGDDGKKTVKFGKIGALPVPGSYSDSSCTALGTFSRRTATWRLGDCSHDVDNSRVLRFGAVGDLPVPADYDCDGLTDPAVYRRRDSRWAILRSTNNKKEIFRFGKPGDIPLPADYKDIGCALPTVYRPTTNEYVVRKRDGSSATKHQWGLNGDVAFPVNPDGGATNFAVLRPQEMKVYIRKVSTAQALSVVSFPKPTQKLSAARQVQALSIGGVNIDIGSFTGGFLDQITPIFEDILPSVFANVQGTDYGINGDFFGGSFTFLQIPEILPAEVHDSTRSVPVANPGNVYAKVPGDYFGFQRSDFVVTRPVSDERTWSFLHADGTTSLYLFGAATDFMLTPADYDGDRRQNLAFVRANDHNALEWHVRSPSGKEYVENFGLKGDIALAGDFDCDGKADKSVVRNSGGFLYWFVKMTGGLKVENYQFGLLRDRFFASDVNGDGCDEIVVVQKSGGLLQWFALDVLEGNFRGPIPFGLESDIPLAPIDFTGDGAGDLVVMRPNAVTNSVFLRSFTSTRTPGAPDDSFDFGAKGDIGMTGYFSGINRAEFGVYRPGEDDGASQILVRKFNGATLNYTFGTGWDTLLRPDGTIGRANGASSDPSLADCRQPAFPDGDKKGHLWKPVAEGRNRGKPTFLGSMSIKRVDIYAADGTFVTNVPLRYYGGPGGRSVWDPPMSGSQLKRYAPITVKSTLFSGICELRTVPDPTKRVD